MSQTYHYDRPSWHYSRPNLLEEAIQNCSRLSKSRPFLDKIGKVTEKQLKNIISVVQAFLALHRFGYVAVWDVG